jgi:sugar/nucleoside kinase (ribokinase family)
MKRAAGLDVVMAGLAVVDVIGKPVDLRRPPRAGGLQLVDSITLTTGGNVSNCGIDLARLGFRVGAITRIGNDTLGEFVRHQYARYGMDTTGVTVDRSRQTSATFVAVDPRGERTFLHTRGCLARFRARDVLKHIGMIKRARFFAFGYLGLLPECEPDLPRLFATIKRHAGVKILLDTGGNPKRNPRLLRSLLPFVDIFLPSAGEARVLTGERTPGRIVGKLRAWGASGVVGVKLGAQGCYVDHDGEAHLLPAKRVRRVVDATGAGDAFVAGFLAATLRGYEPFAAARIANAIAASCVSAVGASTAIKQLHQYL